MWKTTFNEIVPNYINILKSGDACVAFVLHFDQWKLSDVDQVNSKEGQTVMEDCMWTIYNYIQSQQSSSKEN